MEQSNYSVGLDGSAASNHLTQKRIVPRFLMLARSGLHAGVKKEARKSGYWWVLKPLIDGELGRYQE